MMLTSLPKGAAQCHPGIQVLDLLDVRSLRPRGSGSEVIEHRCGVQLQSDGYDFVAPIARKLEGVNAALAEPTCDSEAIW
jgi:hypothetical protein